MNHQFFRLNSGLRIITVPVAGSRTVSLLIMLAAGSKYEKKSHGGAFHFLEHMCFKGTARRPQPLDISAELDGLGAKYNAFTGHDYTGYYATAEAKHFDQLLDILTDLYLNPLLPAEEIEKEKGVIIEEINMYRDTPRYQAQELFYEAVYGDQPAGRSISGPPETVSPLPRAHLLALRRRPNTAASTVVVVAGQLDRDYAVNAIGQSFRNLAAGAPIAPPVVRDRQSEPQVLTNFRKSDQTHLILGFRSWGANRPEEQHVLEILSAVLGGGMSSRLFRRIRHELGAAYYVGAEQSTFTTHGILEIFAGANQKMVSTVVSVILEECVRLRDELVPAVELQRVKDALVGRLVLDLETASQQARFYGSQAVVFTDVLSLTQHVERYRAVTARAVMAAARALFTSERLNAAIVGPVRKTSSFVNRLRL